LTVGSEKIEAAAAKAGKKQNAGLYFKRLFHKNRGMPLFPGKGTEYK
jgi:hypothetical protein